MGQQAPAFETLEVYQLADGLAGAVWAAVAQWSVFARDTIGKQLVRAADSIGANLAEGYGRGSYADNKRFALIARGSMNETICWLTRAADRHLLTPGQVETFREMTDELGPRLNGYLNYLSRQIRAKVTPGQSPPKG